MVRGMGMAEEYRNLDIRKKNHKGTWVILTVVAAAVMILAAASRNYFKFLERQLFEERKSHIVEFTDNASKIVDSVIEYSWKQVYACEHILDNSAVASEEELMDLLVSTADFIDGTHTFAIAFDQEGNYFSSDYKTGRWEQDEWLSVNADDKRQVVSRIPHKAGKSYFLFMKRLDHPLTLQDEGRLITHLAVAVDIDVIREKISVRGLGDQCYTYLVDKDGRILYRYTYGSPFMEESNVLNEFRNYVIVHGGTYEEFAQKIEQDEDTVLEFEFVAQNGNKENWFVSNAAVIMENWHLLLFIPTKVLGEDSALLLDRTTSFFLIFSAVFLVLVTVVVVIAMISKSDKKLVRQKDEANQLLKEAADELRTVADEANSANQAKSDFLSHMSHDIRTPINGIMGMTEIALKNIGNQEKVLDCLQKISGSSQHLLGLVNDVLDMSRIESGKTKVNYENFDLRTCIDNCASIIGGQLATRDLQLVEEVEEFTHPLLIGDELHLRQIFINILGNSVKFTPDGGKIYFRAEEKESTQDKALFHFELADTGIGMKKEFLPHIFEAFAQEDDGTRTTYKGTGLGMAITKKFIDMMGGTIEVISELNAGTTFLLEFWIDIDKDAKQNEVKSEVHANLQGMKTLLVEDIELNLEIAQSILEEEGAVVTPAMNGQEAVDAFVNNPAGTFDVIIMDIMMPVMDGITATKTIRALERPDAKTIPIIAMTANAYEEDIRNTQAAGMNAHLSKPIDVNLMFKTLSHFYPVVRKEAAITTLQGLKILLADDVDLNLEIARTVLEEEGAAVICVENGREAVDAFADSEIGAFHVILMDVHMPVMDGLTATRIIRKMDRKDAQTIPILAMTADVYEEDMEKTKAAGMDGHLTKPLDVEKMMWTLSGYRRTT